MTEVFKVIGPPGTGKTHTLLKEAYNVFSIGEDFTYVTFSKAARRDAVDKFIESYGAEYKMIRQMFRTLHSVAYESVGRSRGDGTHQVNDRDRLTWCERVGLHFIPMSEAMAQDDSPFSVTHAEGPGADWFSTYDVIRHLMLDVRDPFNWDMHSDGLHADLADQAASLVDSWEAFKKLNRAWEQTDNLVGALKHGVVTSGNLGLFDEFQDFSKLMHAVFEQAKMNHKVVWLGGDDDQSLYRFRGGSARAFLDEPGIVKELNESRRIPNSVHRFARQVVSAILDGHRFPKSFKARAGEGNVSLVEREDVAELVTSLERKGRNVLLLARTNRLTARLAEAIAEEGVAHIGLRARTLWSGKLLPACNGIIRLRRGERVPAEEVLALLDCLPPQGAIEPGKKSNIRKDVKKGFPFEPDEVLSWFTDKTGKPEDYLVTSNDLAVARFLAADRIVQKPRVRLGTIHASKGLESDVVILDTSITRRIRKEIEDSEEAFEDERRVFYVGVTRARNDLYLIPSDDMIWTTGEWAG